MINVSAVSEFTVNGQPPAIGVGGCESAAETARAVPARATARYTEAAAFKRRQTPLLQVPLFPPDMHRSMLLNVWHSSPVPGLPSLCNATPVQLCPGFLQSHQTCWAAELNPKLTAGSLTQAVTVVPDPSSTSAWGKTRQGAPMPGR